MDGGLQRRKEKGIFIKSLKATNEQFGRKINEDVDGNRKLFWKEVLKVNGGKVENFSRIKDGNRRLALGEDEVQRNLERL